MRRNCLRKDRAVTFQRIISRVRHRALLCRAAQWAGIGAAAGLAVALTLVVIDRLVWIETGVFTWATIVTIGLIAGVLAAIARQRSPQQIAMLIDQSLHLGEQLSTAERLQHTSGVQHDPEFAALVRHDANALAAHIDARGVAPFQLPRSWIAAAILLASTLAANAWLPHAPSDTQVAMNDTPDPSAPELTVPPDTDAADALTAAIDNVREEVTEPSPDVEESLAELDALSEQLASTEDPDEQRRVREQSAAELDEIADRLTEEVEQQLETAEALAERFTGATPEPEPGRDPIGDAIRSGDFDALADLLDAVTDQRDQLSDADRDAVAEQLQNAADAMKTMSDAERQAVADQLEDLQRDLAERGVDEETVEDLLDDEQTRSALEEQLAEQGTDEETSQEIAEKVDELKRRQELNEEVDETAQEVEEALEETAREMREGREDADTGTDERQGEPESTEQRQGEPEATEQREGEPESTEQREGEPESTEQREGESNSTEQRRGEQEDNPDRTTQRPGDRLRDMARRQKTAEEQRDLAERMREASRDMMDRGEPDEAERRFSSSPTDESKESGEVGGAGDQAGDASPPSRLTEAERDVVDLHDKDELPPERVIAEWLRDRPVGEPGTSQRTPGAARSAQRTAERAVTNRTVPNRYHKLIRQYFERLSKRADDAADAGPAKAPAGGD